MGRGGKVRAQCRHLPSPPAPCVLTPDLISRNVPARQGGKRGGEFASPLGPMESAGEIEPRHAL